MNALVLHNARLILREPGPAISRILSPLALMVLIRPLIQASDPSPEGSVRAVLLPLLLFSMLGLSVVANALLGERIWHTLDRLRATPLRATSLVLGKCATPLAILLLQQLVVLGVGIAAFGLRPQHVLLLAAVGLCWAVTVLSLGAALAAVTTTPSSVSAITDITSLISTALSGALLPLAGLPAWARLISPISPGYWGLRAFEAAFGGSTTPALQGCAVLLVMAVAATAFAAQRLWR
jgi:ABC-2 type transport system permease protein